MLILGEGMFRIILRIVLLTLIICGGSSQSWCADTLTILHINDFHGRLLPYLDKTIDPSSQVGGAAYLGQAINDERKKNPGSTILLSAGDMFQGTPISNLFRGKPVLDFMNLIGFDAMAMGNHELDWGLDVFGDIMAGAKFPILSANIVDSKNDTLPGVRPYVIIERKGYKIGVIGFTTPSVLHMVNQKFLKGRKVLKPELLLPAIINDVKAKGADVVVLLNHLGFDEDKQVASAASGIDVIIGGHSHTAVSEAVSVENTLVAQAGSNGIYLGVANVTLEKRDGHTTVLEKKGFLKTIIAKADTPYDSAIALMAKNYSDKIKDRFQEVVGETTADLMRYGEDGESNIGNAITDAMREATGANVAFHNPGGIRADIPKGKITMEQVYTVLPFDNVIVTMDLSGSDLLSLFETGSGVGRGVLQVSGARIVYDPSLPLGKRVVEALVNGKPVDMAKVYRVVTNDFLSAGGDKFQAFQNGKNVTQGEELREVFLKYVKAKSPLKTRVEGRITIKGQ
jgi:2',3'-cyclic-nucleotide 2'-phosphodiesterase (5'-nucleotidase family)